MQLSLTFLGTFHATWRQHPLEFATDSARALLAYLAVEGDRPHLRGSLATLLWPERSQATAHANLRQTLARLRKALHQVENSPPPLLITPKTVQFQRAAATIDVLRFEELHSVCAAHDHSAPANCPACVTRMRQAVELYRGDFLQELHLEHSQFFEEWLLFKREQLQRLALEMLHHLTLHARESADYTQMAHFATRQLVLEPWREEAHRQMMWALAAGGQTNAALAHYATCCRVLAEQLDVKPDSETTELYERIRSGVLTPRATAPVGQEAAAGAATIAPTPLPKPTYQPLAEVPSVPVLFGRQHELAQVVAWLASERCQVVGLLGIGGVGKTTLAASVVQVVAHQFDMVLWRSLLNAPPIDETLRILLQSLGNHRVIEIPASLDEQLSLLLSYLRQQRCLLVLDNLESVLNQGQSATYRTDYDGYSQLVQRLAQSKHASSLLLTSRERPKGLARLEEDFPVVRSLRLAGLDAAAGNALLSARGLRGDSAQTAKLVDSYSGNPLALKVVVETVHDLFGGDIAAFLDSEAIIFDDIRTVLDQQFAVLSPLEQELLFWLAVEREPVALQVLRDNLLHPPPSHLLMEALRGLERRSLLEQALPARPFQDESQTAVRFMLQNVIMEYVTERLIEQICREIEEGHLVRLHSHALLNARAKEYVRRSQVRMILQPITTRLVASLGKVGWVEQVKQCLTLLRGQAQVAPGYAGGNLLNLMLQAGIDLQGSNFSGLAVRRAYLANRQLTGVNFVQADLTGAVFTDTFSPARSLAFSPDGSLLAAGTSTGEIRLWQVVDGQPLAVLSGHFKLVISVTWSADPRRLASGGEDGTVRVWHRQGLAESETVWSGTILHKGPAIVRAVAFHPEQPILASASDDGKIHLWHATTGHAIAALHGHTTLITAMAFAPHENLLASCSADRCVRIWDMTGIDGLAHDCTLAHSYILYQPPAHLGEVWSLAFSADGRWLAGGNINGLVWLWDITELRRQGVTSEDPSTGQESGSAPVHVLHGHQDTIASLSFGRDSNTLVTGSDDHTIRIWDVLENQTRRTLYGHTDVILCVATQPASNLLASSSPDGTICLWDTESGLPIRTLVGYIKPVTAIAFGRDPATLISCSGDHLVRVWHLSDTAANKATCRTTLAGHTNRIWSVAIHPHGSLAASAGEDRSIHLWDIAGGRLLQRLNGHKHMITTVAFHPNGKTLASGSLDQSCGLWEITSGERRATLLNDWSPPNRHNGVWSLAYSPDGRLLAAGYSNGEIALWDTEQHTIVQLFQGHEDWVRGLAFDPTGRLLASSSNDTTVRIWNVETGQPGGVLRGHTDWVMAVDFNPDGRLLASAGHDRTIRLWNLDQENTSICLTGHSNAILTLAFSPDGKLLVSGSQDESMKLWAVGSAAVGEACVQTVYTPGPYAGMNIAGVTGISEAQKAALKMLGAVDAPG